MRTRWLMPLLLLLGFAARGEAQESTCNLIRSGLFQSLPESATFTDPFAFRCTDGTELSASQGTLNKLTRELHLVGDVHYRDPTRTLTAQDAVYNNAIGRLYATGNVIFTDEAQGMTLRGPELEYFKEMPPSRPQAQVNAGQRPHLTLKPKAGARATTSAARSDEPLEIDGDRMSLIGENDLSMFGNVIIQRTDLRATSGEARYNGATEGLELRQKAEIRNPDYTLRGEVIQARMPGGALEHVESHTHSFLQGKDLTVTSAELQMFFEKGQLQRTVARGGEKGVERPLAVSRSFRLQADSLDALMPAQQLQRVIAIGNARGESMDTTRTDSARVAADTTARRDSTVVAADTGSALALTGSDWIVGDTITGFFAAAPDSAAPANAGAGAPARADTAVVLKRILARGSALSLYRIEQQRGTRAGATGGRRGINFLSGSEIELIFEGGELKVADVKGLEKGLYLDPTLPTPAAPTPPSPEEGNG